MDGIFFHSFKNISVDSLLIYVLKILSIYRFTLYELISLIKKVIHSNNFLSLDICRCKFVLVYYSKSVEKFKHDFQICNLIKNFKLQNYPVK